ncbi:hypothetical protein [Sorangium sp. So ce1078]|uniref:hypothetical protein n=1 Tax=Sorangium sp. So ce1078 TaxID=3133329 RepID=UPI003F61A98B
MDDTGRVLIAEGDGTAQGAGKRGDHGGPSRRVGWRELAKLKRRRLGRGWVDVFRTGSIGGLVPPKSRVK